MVRTKKAADMTSSVESATWKPTMALPDQALRRRVALREPSFSAVLMEVRVERQAGAMPKRMPVGEGDGGGEGEDAPVEGDAISPPSHACW